jgi:hypothetical protein
MQHSYKTKQEIISENSFNSNGFKMLLYSSRLVRLNDPFDWPEATYAII